MGYRPHLDGIRAIAVYLVVAFHAGSDRFDGGFIGVDVFFVLSGYLVTRLLLRDIDGKGSIGYRRFYGRRVRRLLPAALVVLLATAAIYPSIATRADLSTAADSIKAAALYVANWFFIRQSSDYFAADVQSNPVIHFWSLSIEEQFYLVWPLLLGGMFAFARRFGNRASQVVRIIVVGALVLSLANGLRLANVNVGRAYFGTDTRAYQLLAGALLALTPAIFARVPTTQTLRRLVSLAGVGALVALLFAATSTVSVGPVTRGVIATVLTVTLIISMELGPGVVRSALSWKPIVYLGRISYGTYLWHWLIILVAIHAFALDPTALFVIAAVVASGLASLSYQVLEHPVRESQTLARHPRTVVAVALSASVLVGIVVAPRLLDRQASGSVSADASAVVTGTGRIPANFDWQSAQKRARLIRLPRLQRKKGCPVHTRARLGETHPADRRQQRPHVHPCAGEVGAGSLADVVCRGRVGVSLAGRHPPRSGHGRRVGRDAVARADYSVPSPSRRVVQDDHSEAQSRHRDHRRPAIRRPDEHAAHPRR